MSIFYISHILFLVFLQYTQEQYIPLNQTIQRHISNEDGLVHFDFNNGNEFYADINEHVIVDIRFIGGTKKVNLLFCPPTKGKRCIVFHKPQSTSDSQLGVPVYVSEHGTWTVYIQAEQQERISIAYIQIHNKDEKRKHKDDEQLLWCTRSDSNSYVTFGDRPICPRHVMEDASVEPGTLTVMKPNIVVQKFNAYSCSVLSTTVTVNCRGLGLFRSIDPGIDQPVSPEICRSWVDSKKCEFGELTLLNNGDTGKRIYATKNVPTATYDFFKSCLGGIGVSNTAKNCVLKEETIRFMYPYTQLDTPLGSYPLSNVANGYVNGTFRTIIWDSVQLKDVCKYIPFETINVMKTTYGKLDTYHLEHSSYNIIKEVIHFKSDKHAAIYVATDTQAVDVKDIPYSGCMHKNYETYSLKGNVILQYISKSNLNNLKTGIYTNVRHIPRNIKRTTGNFSQTLRFYENTNYNYDTTSCNITGINEGYKCVHQTLKSRRRRSVLTNPQMQYLYDVLNNRLDSTIKNITMSWCEQQQHLYDLYLSQATIDPSKVFSTFLGRNVKVRNHGDVYALLPCVYINFTTITVVESLYINYKPLRTVYINKGVRINDDDCFTRPIVNFTKNGQTAFGQLVSPNEISSSLTNIGKCRGVSFYNRLQTDRQHVRFFKLSHYYYVFKNNILSNVINADSISNEKEINKRMKANEGSSRSHIDEILNIKSVDIFTPMELDEDEYLEIFDPGELYSYKERHSEIDSIIDVYNAINKDKELIDYYHIITNKADVSNVTTTFDSVINGIGNVGLRAGEGIGKFVGGLLGGTVGGVGTSFINGLTSFMNTLVARIFTIVGVAGGLCFFVYFGITTALNAKRGAFNPMSLTHPPQSNYMQPKPRKKRAGESKSRYKAIESSTSEDDYSEENSEQSDSES